MTKTIKKVEVKTKEDLYGKYIDGDLVNGDVLMYLYDMGFAWRGRRGNNRLIDGSAKVGREEILWFDEEDFLNIAEKKSINTLRLGRINRDEVFDWVDYEVTEENKSMTELEERNIKAIDSLTDIIFNYVKKHPLDVDLKLIIKNALYKAQEFQSQLEENKTKQ